MVHFSEGQEVEVASEALGDGIAASTWRSHGTGKIDVHQVLESTCLVRTGNKRD